MRNHGYERNGCREANMMGLLDQVRPILGYIVAIAVILVIAGLAFMSSVSSTLASSATVMASLLVVVALLVGIGAASKAAREA
jgi:drug/metabolite transporter (DMT)-like permease